MEALGLAADPAQANRNDLATNGLIQTLDRLEPALQSCAVDPGFVTLAEVP